MCGHLPLLLIVVLHRWRQDASMGEEVWTGRDQSWGKLNFVQMLCDIAAHYSFQTLLDWLLIPSLLASTNMTYPNYRIMWKSPVMTPVTHSTTNMDNIKEWTKISFRKDYAVNCKQTAKKNVKTKKFYQPKGSWMKIVDQGDWKEWIGTSGTDGRTVTIVHSKLVG